VIITNRYNLPKAFVELAKQEYKVAPYEYRVTSLLKGLRETILLRRHGDEIKVDVADMVWLLFGTAVHDVLERQKEDENELKEERLKVKFGDYTLSGKFDLYNASTKTITDYKTASVWKVIFGDFVDWRRQLLIYAYMMQSYGFPVGKGEIIAFLKDHSKRDAKYKPDYPILPVYSVQFEFTKQDFQEIEEWLWERFQLIAQVETLADSELPLCTPEERFNSGDKFAVMKKGRKTALRVLDSMEDAEQWIKDNNKGDYIETRAGEDKKCNDYCFVNQFCNYYLSKKEAVS